MTGLIPGGAARSGTPHRMHASATSGVEVVTPNTLNPQALAGLNLIRI
jgi:hypothetical protein